MPTSTTTLTTPAAVLTEAPEALSPTIGLIYRTTAQLRAHWLNHRAAADVALVATLLLLAAAALIAAR